MHVLFHSHKCVRLTYINKRLLTYLFTYLLTYSHSMSVSTEINTKHRLFKLYDISHRLAVKIRPTMPDFIQRTCCLLCYAFSSV